DAADEAASGREEPREASVSVGGTNTPRFSTFTSSEAWASRFASFGHNSVLTIGSFDGIHLGHQAVLRSTVERARALKAVPTVLTFHPSPRKVLRPETAPPQLSTMEQLLDCFGTMTRPGKRPALPLSHVKPWRGEGAAPRPECVQHTHLPKPRWS